MTRSYLNREAILSAEDRPTDEIQIPEWGDTWVRIARWSLAVQWRISRASADDQEERGRLLALVAALSLVDARGQRLFSDEDLAGARGEELPRAGADRHGGDEVERRERRGGR